VFALRRLEGLELAEIASNLDLSLATVKRDLDKASAFVAREIHRDEHLHLHLVGNPDPSLGGHDDDAG
jgi:DNA-directed RNA polymerase specialized sigma24 family protein